MRSPVVLHSDHCAHKLLPWFDGMLKADEEYFQRHGEPLFSSHMLDLSEESKEENIATCVKYFERMAPLGLWLEMEIGITGGEEGKLCNFFFSNFLLDLLGTSVFGKCDSFKDKKLRGNTKSPPIVEYHTQRDLS